MKVLEVKALAIAEIKVIRFGRFCDQRGYFTEQFRRSDLQTSPHTLFLKGVEFVQANESFSRAGTIRGLHFQWNPYMGKLVRTLQGHMIDLVLDIRKGAPTFGKIVGYDMPARRNAEWDEWIWVPPGFAHGNMFVEDTLIEYLCSGEYSSGCEAGISPLAKDIDWSLSEPSLKDVFDRTVSRTPLITEKDRNALVLSSWDSDDRSNYFVYSKLQDMDDEGTPALIGSGAGFGKT
jgi:dTDP-4-dehydrorhamnose 3,5-epimerase